MDKYSRSLARFLEMRVQIRLGTYTTVFGTLVEVNSEFLRLENSRIVDEYEESDWSSKITEGDPDMIAASSDGESLIRMNYVSSVTCMSDQMESSRSSQTTRFSESTVPLHELADSTGQDVFARPFESEDAVSDMSYSSKTSVDAEGSYPSSSIDEICIELGANLLPMSDAIHDGKLLQRIETLRREIDTETGFVLPPVRVRSSIQLDANEYRILVHECEFGRFQLQPKMQLLIRDEESPGDEFDVREPRFGLHAKWVAPDEFECERTGSQIDCTTILATHLREIVLGQTSELLRFESVQKLLDRLRYSHPVLVAELIPSQLSIRLIHFILKRLLRERVSIRNLPLIIEAISDVADHEISKEEIVRHVRQKCGRIVCSPYINHENKLSAITLSPDAESVLSGANCANQDFDPLEELTVQLFEACHPKHKPTLPILVASVDARERIWQRMNANNHCIAVIGTNEVPRRIQVHVVEKIELRQAKGCKPS